jgi:glycosyltransferase involved in cell wall biosynthesis
MKIALCSSFVPFLKGGAKNIVEWLESALQEAGHQVERIYLPAIYHTTGSLFPQMMAYRWIDLTDAVDRIICFRPPAHLIPHPQKILWFIHHLRAFYDLWDTQYRGFPDDGRHRGLREAMHAIDTAAFREARRVFTNSQVVSDRVRMYNKVHSEVLYPPIYKPERFRCGSFSDEVVYLSRIEQHKRQHLLVEAMRYTCTGVKLRLSGECYMKEYAQELRGQIAADRLEDRVTFEDRWISESDKVEVLADCLAAAYLPLDEDSYGYPSLEASHASKPVLTTTDSGGVVELVKDGFNGLVVDADPKALAEAMDRLYLDREATRRMGQNAHARLGVLKISWPHVIERLLS